MSIEEHLDALLVAGEATREEIEAALTHGHAAALELEADRIRLTRRLDRARTIPDPALDGVVATAHEELAGVTAALQSLRGRLADVAARFGSGARFSDRAG